MSILSRMRVLSRVVKLSIAHFALRTTMPKFLLESHEGEEIGNIYINVGYAITLWSQIETTLILMTASLLEAPVKRVGIVMYQVNFTGWINIITDLISADSSKYVSQRKAWNQSVSNIRKLKDVRDYIAHSPLREIDGKKAITAPFLDTRSKSIKRAPLNRADLDLFIFQGTELNSKLSALEESLFAEVQRLRGLKPVHEES